jgi:glycosyltransferase involved in cell wall biosynthesis
MRLVILTQVLDQDDAVLGFFHAWCDRFAHHVQELVVVAQQVGRVDLPDNVSVVSLGREHGAGRKTMAARMLGCLMRLPRGPKPTVVLGHMVPRFVLNAAPAATLRRFPLFLWYTHKGVDLALKLAAPLVRRVFTASPESFRLESSAHRRVVTGHGIDCTQFDLPSAAGPRPVDVLCVGRITHAKGQAELLDALARVDPAPSAELAGDILLDSDRAYRDEVAARAAAMGGPVTLLGAVPYPKIADAMRRARLLVNTSRTGSVDKVVLEAMACGTIPLTCNESFRSVFDAELQERLMFSLGDADDLASRLTALLTLPDAERAALGQSLRQIVQRDHDLERLIPRIVAEMESAS